MINTSVVIESKPIPSAVMLDQIIDLKFGVRVNAWLEPTLLTPISDILGRPSKRFRATLVRLGCLLASQRPDLTVAEQELCIRFGDLIELLHAGSLVVDDIEDQSVVRRGQPALHLKYGVPIALNAGNWLYFWPLMLIDHACLPLEKELWVRRHYHHTMIKVHCGQALDAGVPVDQLPQEEVPGLCLSAMELKTGALIALALLLGSIAAELPIAPLPALDEFGHGLGIALQKFDDLGNLQGRKEPEKRYEDLINRRPCWIWAFAAQRFSKPVYRRFVEAVAQLPDDTQLQKWVGEHDVLNLARREALESLERVHQKCELSLGPERPGKTLVLKQLRLLGQQISNSYS
ncbi:MAG TPA: polyprenyl synthetase family protein [Blastocatellia bacterium]|nr:polyprenyl synthetase family protein [Blastocatellia bacterium]